MKGETRGRPVDPAERFEFGANWSRFLEKIDSERISLAQRSLREFLHVDDLHGRTFLDAGCGSGLFSLAARSLGATVTSFDYDSKSVECARALKETHFPGDPNWMILQGSVLDDTFLAKLGIFDVVYSWGVLHHTGHMWTGMNNLIDRTKPGGSVYIAIYNDEGWKSRVWREIKRMYVRLPRILRPPLVLAAFVRMWGPRYLLDCLRLEPLASWKAYSKRSRGMDPWRDVIDWVGGYPYEVASVREVFRFFRDRGFGLAEIKPCGPESGVNEFAFTRNR